MTTKYQTNVERYGRTETITDVRRFAADLARALKGGELLPPKEDAIGDEKNSHAEFMVGADRVSVRGNSYGLKGRVTVRIEAPDVQWGDRNTYAKDHRTEEATVNPEARSIEAIAKDVQKRVIDPSQSALKLQREYAAQQHANRDGIAAHIKALSKAAPSISVRRQDERAQSASIYSQNSGHYVSGTLNCDGSISLSHIGSMPMSKFVAIMQILNSKET